MPAQIVNALVRFLQPQVNANIWDGEVPRQALLGEPINPEAGSLDWPVIKLYMPESGFQRQYPFEDPYTDSGTIQIHIWATRREVTESTMNTLEALLARSSNWAQISTLLGGDPTNPYYVIHLLLTHWYSGHEEEVRTSKSEFLYRCDMTYECLLHGAISGL